MSETSKDQVIIAGKCFVCGGDLVLEDDGILRCAECQITLKVARKGTDEKKNPPPQKKPAPKKKEPPADPPAPEVTDEEVVALADSLAADPSTPITTPQMNRITKANSATHRACLPALLTLAQTALDGRKFRRAVPLFTVICAVEPSPERYISLMLAKANCASVEEIPASDTELTTMAEYPRFLQLANAEIRDFFLSFVRKQAERLEEAEEARMEEERQAYITIQSKRLSLLYPTFYFFAILAVLSLVGVLTIGFLGVRFDLGRLFFSLSIILSIAAIGAFWVTDHFVRNIDRTRDTERTHRSLVLVGALFLLIIITSALTMFFSGISGGYDGRVSGFYYETIEGGVAVSCPATTASTLHIPATIHGKPVLRLTDFSDSTQLTEVRIPESVIEIAPFAFAGCTQLTDIALPANLTTLGNGVFKNCVSLKTIYIPARVSTIGSYAFTGCISLSEITFAEDSILSTIGTSAFENCTSLAEIHLPSTVSTISANAFFGATKLTTYTGAENLASIGKRAFYGCTALTTPALPAGLSVIGTEAFYGCSSLTSLVFPLSITLVENRAFFGCPNLIEAIFLSGSAVLDGAFDTTHTFVEIPETPASHFHYTSAGGEVTITGYIGKDTVVAVPSYIDGMPVVSISAQAFENSPITLITLPNTLLFIDNSAFRGCLSLTTVRFGTKLEAIDMYAFQGCIALTQLDLGACEQLTIIREFAFSGCSSLAEIRFAPNLHAIQKYAFEHCTALSTVILPDSLTELCAGAFQECKALRTFRLGAGPLTIGPDALRNCTNIKQITIGKNVKIEEQAYQGILYCPFTGWLEDQTVTILQKMPAGFEGYNCEAYIKWSPQG